MKEKPILFSGPMVKAILEGRKTQTRRVVSDQSSVTDICGGGVEPTVWWPDTGRCPYGGCGEYMWVRETWMLYDKHESRHYLQDHKIPDSPNGLMPGSEGYWKRRIRYAATEKNPDPVNTWKWRPGIHMPRWASRITLAITDVRVELLNDISEADARSEGIQVLPLQSEDDPSAWWQSSPGVNQERTARASFRGLWNFINRKKNPWESNPWVWVVSFERVK